MWKRIQERIFPFIIASSALSVSASAAFYSISGLSKLFAGAALAVIIMTTSLEVAKLVIASLLYQYRKTIPKLLKYYLTVAAVVLVLITSMGIYGFLSAAYQETAAKAGSIDAQISLIETKRDNVREQLAVYSDEKSSINTAVAELRSGLSNNKIQYKDRETGQIITTTSSSTRRSLEKQLDQAILRQTEINTKVDGLNERLFEYETEIVEVSINNDIAGELGPLKYLSGLTGTPMDKIINYLLLTIIFVFDPLAIALVIAANYSFELLKGKTKENIYGENVIDEVQEETQSKQTLEELHTLTESHKELLKTLEIINSPSHSDILRKLNKLDKMIDLEEEVKPDNIKEDDGLVLVERPHRIYGTHTMVVSKDNIPKGYSPKKKDEDLTITY
mgnify:FL=1|tara:strand:- start:1053 stop:2225 length:1173 start_codon:yes stop_codon:yes gene_type:complete